MNIKEFRDLILNESVNIIVEEDEIKSLEDMIKYSEEDVKRLKNLSDAENAYSSKVTDQDLKKSSSIKVQELKKQSIDAQANLDALKKVYEAKKKAMQNNNNKEETSLKVTQVQTSTQVSEAVPAPAPAPVNIAKPIAQPPAKTKKTYLVKFDQNTEAPFSVSFSQRGFLIGDTRLSFELLEKAINKGFTITLKNGFILNPIRMQKILKYKDRF